MSDRRAGAVALDSILIHCTLAGLLALKISYSALHPLMKDYQNRFFGQDTFSHSIRHVITVGKLRFSVGISTFLLKHSLIDLNLMF